MSFPMNDETKTPEPSRPVPPPEDILHTDAALEIHPGQQPDPRDSEIVALKEEAGGLKDRLLRLAAEMDNLRKRSEREKAEATLYAATNFARDLLSVADNMRRALEAVSPEQREQADENVYMNETEQAHGGRILTAGGADDNGDARHGHAPRRRRCMRSDRAERGACVCC